MDRPKEDDRELIQFKELYKSIAPMLIIYAGKYVNAVTAEDLVQDVFVKMWEFREQWKGVENFSAYIYQMVRFRCFNYLRGEKLREEMMRSYKEEKLSIVEINQYIEEEIFRLVNQAMDSLPSTYKQVITLTLEG